MLKQPSRTENAWQTQSDIYIKLSYIYNIQLVILRLYTRFLSTCNTGPGMEVAEANRTYQYIITNNLHTYKWLNHIGRFRSH
jgi:hypothetical protein